MRKSCFPAGILLGLIARKRLKKKFIYALPKKAYLQTDVTHHPANKMRKVYYNMFWQAFVGILKCDRPGALSVLIQPLSAAVVGLSMLTSF